MDRPPKFLFLHSAKVARQHRSTAHRAGAFATPTKAFCRDPYRFGTRSAHVYQNPSAARMDHAQWAWCWSQLANNVALKPNYFGIFWGTNQHTQSSNQSHDLILSNLQGLLQEIQRLSWAAVANCTCNSQHDEVAKRTESSSYCLFSQVSWRDFLTIHRNHWITQASTVSLLKVTYLQ